MTHRLSSWFGLCQSVTAWLAVAALPPFPRRIMSCLPPSRDRLLGKSGNLSNRQGAERLAETARVGIQETGRLWPRRRARHATRRLTPFRTPVLEIDRLHGCLSATVCVAGCRFSFSSMRSGRYEGGDSSVAPARASGRRRAVAGLARPSSRECGNVHQRLFLRFLSSRRVGRWPGEPGASSHQIAQPRSSAHRPARLGREARRGSCARR